MGLLLTPAFPWTSRQLPDRLLPGAVFIIAALAHPEALQDAGTLSGCVSSTLVCHWPSESRVVPHPGRARRCDAVHAVRAGHVVLTYVGTLPEVRWLDRSLDFLHPSIRARPPKTCTAFENSPSLPNRPRTAVSKRRGPPFYAFTATASLRRAGNTSDSLSSAPSQFHAPVIIVAGECDQLVDVASIRLLYCERVVYHVIKIPLCLREVLLGKKWEKARVRFICKTDQEAFYSHPIPLQNLNPNSGLKCY